MKYIEKLAINVVKTTSIIMLTILFIYSIFNTVFLYDIEEHCFFLEDSLIMHIIGIICVLLATIVVYRIFEKVWTYIREEHALILLGFSFLLGMGWILLSQAKPTGDSMYIFEIANSLHAGDTIEFTQGAYMYFCPNQKGIVLFCYFLQMLAGTHNYLFFQFLNVCALVISQWFIYKIVLYISENLKLSMLILLTEVCFLPAIMYTSFTYGTMLGFVCVAGAIWLSCKFWKEKKVCHMVFASMLMALSVWLKSNYLICLIGLLLVSIVYALKNTDWKTILFPIVIVIFYLMVLGTSEAVLDELTGGLSRENAFIATAYIEMGLQESTRAPGWFNGYAYKVVQDNDYHKELYEEAVNEDLKESISNFIENPDYAYSFFAQKIISQWCEPTFQSMWIVLVRESLLEQTSILRYWLVAPYSGANILLRDVLNVFQTLIYFGALIYALFEKRKNIIDWTGLIIVLGGFLFHIMWEGKAQYTINYFMLLIPYGIIGLYYLTKRMNALLNDRRTVFPSAESRTIGRREIKAFMLPMMVVVIMVILIIAGVSFANVDDIIYYNNFMIFG